MTGDRKSPTFLVIGAARSGTTAFTHILAQHPDIFITDPKESHFFAFANDPVRFIGPGDDEMINRPMITDPAAYRRQYEGASNYQQRGEGSVSTLCYPHRSVPNIERYAPDAKMIVLLREPVERAHSSYIYLRGRGHEVLETFAEGLAAEDERTAAGWHHMWRYRALGNYASQLAPFIEAFGRGRLLVILHEELRDNPKKTMAEASTFLDVPAFDFETEAQINRGGEPRSRLVVRATGLLRKSETAKRAVRRVMPTQVRERVRLANLRQPELPDVVASQLRSEYAGRVSDLEQMLNIDLTKWKG